LGSKTPTGVEFRVFATFLNNLYLIESKQNTVISSGDVDFIRDSRM